MPPTPAAVLLAFSLALPASLLSPLGRALAGEDAPDRPGAASLSEGQQREAAELLAARPLDLASLDRLVRLRSLADPATARLLAELDNAGAPAAPGEGVSAEALAPNIALRLAAEHFLHRRYEEALAWLALVDAERCASPELAYYYRAVSLHQLGRVEQAGKAAQSLLDIEHPRSRRAPQMARMILRQASAHKGGSLSHIALLMGDVRRRFQLQRSGQADQQVQQEVVDALDKLIEQAEEQQNQQQQQQQQQQRLAQNNNPTPGRPMDDSRPMETRGSGEVPEVDLPAGGAWGELPPAERERVAQQIIRDFPAHYRRVIEDYFRSLAKDQQGKEDAR